MVLLAALVSILWVGFALFVYFPRLFQSEPIVAHDSLEMIAVVLAPVLIIWGYVGLIFIKRVNEIQVADLQSHVDKIRDELARPSDEKIDEQETIEKPEIVDSKPLIASRTVVAQAIHFADDENDKDAFAALDSVSDDPDIRQLLDLSMKVLQALANANHTVETMPTDFAPPDAWRQLSPEATRQALTTLGTVGTPEQRASVQEIFAQDAALKALSDDFTNASLDLINRFTGDANNDEINAFANSRTIRACILLQNATGKIEEAG